jgi:hypothetical protein
MHLQNICLEHYCYIDLLGSFNYEGTVMWILLLCSTNGEKRNASGILMEKLDGKRSLGRPRCRWVEILKWILER